MRQMPNVPVTPDVTLLQGGLDVVTPPLLGKPGTARVGFNYEGAIGGGYRRLGGIERFDGQPRPSDAEYVFLALVGPPAGLSVGDTLTGATSAATGKVIYVSDNLVAVTRTTGEFEDGEDVEEGASLVGVIAEVAPSIDGFVDNAVATLAANDYRLDILAVPGSGPVRGVAVLGSNVYAWRNTDDGTAMAIHKATGSGWDEVTLHEVISFTAGTSEYDEASTLTQGGVSATVMRVVLESGTWTGGTAAGRLIVTTPSGGVFTAGAAAGGGACTLAGASAAITLAPGGNVRTDVFTFTASLADQRLYGCDGVNPEFEFGNDVLVPIATGMGSVRATAVRCHKNHLMYAYRGSLQHSGTGLPYVWSAVFGAAELGTGDEIADLISVGGSEAAAALMVLCRNALFVLYGNDSTDWQMVPLSRVSGCSPGSAQDIAGVVALDAPGFVRYPATQSFGNFAWDTVSRSIEPIARGQACKCSVFVADRSLYRVFFEDGTAVSGFSVAKGRFEWTAIDYGRTITCAVHAEVGGLSRTFYGDADGFVLEADVGRSLDGAPLEYGLLLTDLFQRSPNVLKQYRRCEVELQAESAMTLNLSGVFNNADEDSDPDDAGSRELVQVAQYGAGLIYDLTNFDQAYWDIPGVARRRFPVEGNGTSVALSIAGSADDELPHTLRAVTMFYSQRRMAR